MINLGFQPSYAAGLSECLESLYKNNYQLFNQKREIEDRKLELNKTRSNYYPTLSFIVNGQRFEGDQVSSSNTLFLSNERSGASYSYGLTASQPVFKEGTLIPASTPSVSIANTSILIEEVRKMEMARSLEKEIAVNFSLLDMYRLSIKRWRDIEDCFAKTLARINMEIQAGIKSKIDLTQVMASLKLIQAQIAILTSKMNSVEKDIIDICGINDGVALVTDNMLNFSIHDINIPDVKQLNERALQVNSAIQEIRLALKSSQEDVKRQKSERLPEVNLSGSYLRSGDFIRDKDESSAWNIRMNMSVALWDSGYRNNSIRQAKLSVESKQCELKAKISELRREIATLYEDIYSLALKADASRLNIDALNLQADADRLDQASGTADPIDLCDTKKMLAMEEDTYFEMKQKILENIFTLRSMLGLKTDGAEWL